MGSFFSTSSYPHVDISLLPAPINIQLNRHLKKANLKLFLYGIKKRGKVAKSVDGKHNALIHA